RVVLLLPDEDQVRGRHVVGHERAAARRARKRVCPDAEPAGAIGVLVVEGELLVLDEHFFVDRRPPLHEEQSSPSSSRTAYKRDPLMSVAGRRKQPPLGQAENGRGKTTAATRAGRRGPRRRLRRRPEGRASSARAAV